MNKVLLWFVLHSAFYASAQQQPKLTVEEYLNYVDYPSLSMSPTGRHLLMEKLIPSWDTNSFESSLWMYDVAKNETTLITGELGDGPTGI
jgi:hypothetical protein